MKKIWVYVVFAVLTVIFLPLVIDWLILGNDFPSNVSNADWIGFLGGYIGAVIGSIVSLIGMIITIRFTKEQLEISKTQYEEQKRMNSIPILDCNVVKVVEDKDDEALSMDVEYYIHKEQEYFLLTVYLDIYNIGLGPALNIKYGMKINGTLQDGVFWRTGNQLIKSDSVISEKLFIRVPQNEPFEFSLVMYYEDILGNTYYKLADIIVNYDEDIKNLTFVILAQDKGTLCQKQKQEKSYYVLRPIINQKDE